MSNIDFKQPCSDPPLQKINLSPLAFLSEVFVTEKKAFRVSQIIPWYVKFIVVVRKTSA